MTKTEATNTNEVAVVKKLREHLEENSGTETFTLPKTGILVTYPEFLEHGKWQQALRRSKGDITRAQVTYICAVCTFDGDTITRSHWDKFMPLSDGNELLAEVFVGSDDDGDEAGNDS